MTNTLPRRRLHIEALESRRLLTAVCSDGRDVFTVGLVDCTSDASEGYTLLANDRSDDAYLLDIHGREVHSWENGPYNGRRGAYIGPDGSLYSSGTISNPAQAAGGVTGALYIQDWDGNVTWNYNYSNAERTLHHDLEVMPNGNVLAFSWVAVSAADMIALGRNPANVPAQGLWSERILEFEPTGLNTANIVWEWNMIDHLVQDFDNTKPNFGVIADHPERLDVNLGGANPDWLHFNSIDYNPTLDQIVVNSPFLAEFYVIDHSTTTAEAATSSGGNSGKGGDFLYRWGNPANYDAPGARQVFNQHDVQWIDPGNPGAGNFLLFNNQTAPFSSVWELVPPVDGMGNYSLTAGQAYEPSAPLTVLDTGVNAAFISGAQRLPNGNTMFIHGPDAIIGELTPANDQVWEYISPVTPAGTTSQGSSPPLDNLFKSRRYPDSYSGFAGRDLSPKGYVENWLVGDYNLDGVLNAEDLNAHCQGRLTGDRIYDLNFDDVVNTDDVEFMVTDLLGTLMGDATLDGSVDAADFLAWNDHKFTANNNWMDGDFNCDGFVDGVDFAIWNDNKFTSTDVALGQRDEATTVDLALAATPQAAATPAPPVWQPQEVRRESSLRGDWSHRRAELDFEGDEDLADYGRRKF